MNKNLYAAPLGLLLAASLSISSVQSAGKPAGGQAIYADSLQNGWQAWGWAKVVNYNNSKPVHSGKKSIAVTITKGYDGVFLHHAGFSSNGIRTFSLWANGGAKGGQMLQIQGITVKKTPTTVVPVAVGPLPAKKWTHIVVPLSKLNVANKPDVDGFWIQDHTGHPLPTFYIDDISLSR